MKKILAILMVASAILMIGCSKDAEKDLYANKVFFTIEMEDGGIMKGELYPDLAPITVENFINLCDKDFSEYEVLHILPYSPLRFL